MNDDKPLTAAQIVKNTEEYWDGVMINLDESIDIYKAIRSIFENQPVPITDRILWDAEKGEFIGGDK